MTRLIARVEDGQPPLERMLPVLAHLGALDVANLLTVQVGAQQPADRVDDAGDDVPAGTVASRRRRIGKDAMRADRPLIVDNELRVVVTVLRGVPLVPPRSAKQATLADVLEPAHHAHRVLVEVQPAAILAEWHAEHDEGGAKALVARYSRCALLDAHPLAAPLHPQRRANLQTDHAAREERGGKGEGGWEKSEGGREKRDGRRARGGCERGEERGGKRGILPASQPRRA